jgi:tetratricopeptide (TPR) repeat protein
MDLSNSLGDGSAMAEKRFHSVLTLLRVLTGAEPILRTQPALTTALERLYAARDPRDVARLDRMIWRMWSSAGTRDAVRCFIRALQALARNDLEEAITALDAAVAADFAFAEAWNRRAVAWFLKGDADKSVADIERVLVLEPRHYGALSGLGQILLQEGETAGALAAFEAALAINPHLPEIREACLTIRAALPDRSAKPRLLH